MTIAFRQDTTIHGTMFFEPVNKEAWELLEFLGYSETGRINETKMDKIYDWMTKLGHDVTIYEPCERCAVEW